MAYSAPSTRSTGNLITAAIWNADVVANPIAIYAGAMSISSQAALDFIYASSSTQLARLTKGSGLQSIRLNAAANAYEFFTPGAASTRSLMQFRLSGTTGTSVTTANVTGITTLRLCKHDGDQVSIYDGSGTWNDRTIGELTISVPSTTNTMYDVFVDDNGGTPQLAMTAWTNDSTRATAIVYQDGRLVQSGNTDWLYVGSVRTTGSSGEIDDSYSHRFIWNYYNRCSRPMEVKETTNEWSYTTSTVRQANGSTANQLDFIIGVSEDAVTASNSAVFTNTTVSQKANAGIGLDVTNAFSGLFQQHFISVAAARVNVAGWYRGFPGIGRHFLAALERGNDTGTTTWYGDDGATVVMQNGIQGMIRG